MSLAVGRSLNWQIVPEHFIVVLPSRWNTSDCGQTISQARGDTRYRQTDIIISQNTVVRPPTTLQSRGCGVPGDSLQMSTSWLNKSASNLTSAGRVLAWQFLRLRFGVFPQSGGQTDPIYPAQDSACLPLIDQDCEESFPSLQEDLCLGRSVREVIESSSDFSRVRNQINTPCEGCFRPRIDFVQKHEEQFIILLDTSAAMDDNDGWKYLAKAVKKMIMYDLPDQARLGLVTFSEVSKVEAQLTRLSERTRPRLADVVPDKYRLSSSRVACVETGLRRVITSTDTLLAETHVILVTANNSLGAGISEDIETYLEHQQVKVSTVLLSDKSVLYYDKLGSVSDGKVSIVDNGQAPISRYLQLMEALQFVTGQMRMIHSKIVELEKDTVTTGEFVVSEESELYVVVEDVYSHLVKSVSLSQESGGEFGPYKTLARRRSPVNMLSLYRSPVISPGSAWSYTVHWFTPNTPHSVQAGLTVEGRPGYSARMWTSSDQLTDLVTSASPLAVFVSVTQERSGLPVLRGEVRVSCLMATEAGTSEDCGQVSLRDDGAGPDLRAGDGVYSRTWTQYPGPGRYQFTVTVTHNQGQAAVLEQEGEEECCGRLTKCEEFQVTSPGSALHLLQVPLLTEEDQFPPGRVRDLQLRTGSDPGKVLAVFTAPGDDYDHGRASLYKILVSRNRSELWSSEALFAQSLTEFRAEADAGEEVSFMFDFSLHNEDVFVGLVAMDEAGNVGEMSNIVMVHVYFPSPHLTDASLSTETVSITRSSEDWSLSLALAGAIVFLASFLALGVLYFLKVVKSRKSVASSIQDGVISDSETVSNISASSNLNPMSKSLAESTPNFWSASFLLSTHESMISRNSSPVFRTLPPILEDHNYQDNGLSNPGYRDPGGFHQRQVSLV